MKILQQRSTWSNITSDAHRNVWDLLHQLLVPPPLVTAVPAKSCKAKTRCDWRDLARRIQMNTLQEGCHSLGNAAWLQFPRASALHFQLFVYGAIGIGQWMRHNSSGQSHMCITHQAAIFADCKYSVAPAYPGEG